MKIDVYNIQREKTKEKITLNPAIWEIEINPDLLHQAVYVAQSNLRKSSASTKTRAQVRGGGRKPWRQKGTGRARAGSIRSPIWRGGGVVFGPTPDVNYKKNMPHKAKRKAMIMALSSKVADKQLVVLDDLKLNTIKTKKMAEILEKIASKKSFLLVLPCKNEIIQKSTRNIPDTKVLLAHSLNISDLLNYKFLILTKNYVKKIEEVYSK